MRVGKILVLLGVVMATGAVRATDLTLEQQAALDRKTVTSKYYVDQAIAGKQPILNPTGDSDLAGQVVMYTGNAGEVSEKPISDHLVADTANGETQAGINSNLPTVGAVNTGLSGKQPILNPNNDSTLSGKVVTYTGNRGQVSEKAVYNDTASYAATALIEAAHANDAIQTGLNEHLSCTNDRGPNNECWLWEIKDQAAGTVYTKHSGQ